MTYDPLPITHDPLPLTPDPRSLTTALLPYALRLEPLEKYRSAPMAATSNTMNTVQLMTT